MIYPLPPLSTPTGWLLSTSETVTIGGQYDTNGCFRQWLGCEHPERPWDPEAAYHITPHCYPCRIAMTAHRVNK